MIPTQWFNHIETWAAMLPGMPMNAMLRNLGKMTQIGLLKPLDGASKLVVDRLDNVDAIRKSHLHPWAILNAMYWYRQGHGMFGGLKWTPVQTIVDALDRAFYTSFGNIQPTNQRIMIGVDVSGSMGFPSSTTTVGIDRNGRKVAGMTAAEAVGAMAIITARTEPNYMMVCFDTVVRRAQVSSQSTLAQVVDRIRQMIRGGTDYAAPIHYAITNKLPVDAFVIYGDEQSWRGTEHPTQAMERYRNIMGIQAKLAVVNLCSTATTQADTGDPLALNFVGMDTNTPGLIADFIGNG
jgi:60 kDa SS-A/Ro ribonucleoprotein